MAIVFAATLERQFQVQTCSDSDGGLVFNVTGTVSGIKLSGANYSYTDFCKDTTKILEYTCFSNGTNNFVQGWSENCTNGCANGHCN